MSGLVGVCRLDTEMDVEVADGAATFVHPETRCSIMGDVRLDNRDDLVGALGLDERRLDAAPDAAVAVEAYLAWNMQFLERLRGDFAFGIWDPRERLLLCARDQMGVRSLSYHHSPGRIFAYAAGADALARHPLVPNDINEQRVADYLLDVLEGIDKTSTFYRYVVRLPPAHAIAVRSGRVRTWRYWSPEREDPLRLRSDDDYVDAFREALTLALQARFRAPGPPAAMLSGGIDSGAIVALGRRAIEARAPLMTFSAVSSRHGADPESRAIRASLGMDGIDANVVAVDDLDLAELMSLTSSVEEPFDGAMTLPRALYLAAQRRGVVSLLDGASADTLLEPGRYLARLLRRGRLLAAYREARALDMFWGGREPALRELRRAARSALIPDRVLRTLRPLRRNPGYARAVRASIIRRDFAERTDVLGRLRHLARHDAVFTGDPWAERVSQLEHPYLVVGRERYDRVARAVGVRAADPYLDLRVVSLCLRLPDDQLVGDGWPKLIARRATAGLLPDEVRWRRGREHLGWAYTSALLEGSRDTVLGSLETNLNLLDPYVDSARVKSLLVDFDVWDAAAKELAYTLFCLGEWLRRHADQPISGPVGKPEGRTHEDRRSRQGL